MFDSALAIVLFPQQILAGSDHERHGHNGYTTNTTDVALNISLHLDTTDEVCYTNSMKDNNMKTWMVAVPGNSPGTLDAFPVEAETREEAMAQKPNAQFAMPAKRFWEKVRYPK